MDLRYPIGRFELQGEMNQAQREEWIANIEALPEELSEAVRGLSREQLDTPYRDGGWTVRQVVHHVADSHMNSLIRFKLALTEDNPSIKPYEEQLWAELSDSRTCRVELSLTLIHALHERWSVLLRSLDDEAYNRTFYHPGSQQTLTLGLNLGIYAWHGKHHTAHISALRSRMGW